MNELWIETREPLRRDATRQTHIAAIERVIDHMRRSPGAPLDLQEMADIAIVSRCHFDRVFHERVGVTPRQFQTALRLHEAARLLLTSHMSVTDVCFEVGYESLGSFISRFTRTFGVAPQKLRDHSKRIHLPWGDGLGRVLEHISPEPRPPFVNGSIQADRPLQGPIFVGLFETPMPVNAPVACSVVRAAGSFRIGEVPDGEYYLLGLAVSWRERPLDFLLDETALRGGVLDRPLRIAGGIVTGMTSFSLRESMPTDPPINLALPYLIVNRFLDFDQGLATPSEQS